MRTEVISDPTLMRIIDIIVQTACPKKIILFGSRARGEASSERDYDLFLIIDSPEQHRAMMTRIYKALYREHINTAVDLIAASSEQVSAHRNTIGLVYREILDEGIVLYG